MSAIENNRQKQSQPARLRSPGTCPRCLFWRSATVILYAVGFSPFARAHHAAHGHTGTRQRVSVPLMVR